MNFLNAKYFPPVGRPLTSGEVTAHQDAKLQVNCDTAINCDVRVKV